MTPHPSAVLTRRAAAFDRQPGARRPLRHRLLAVAACALWTATAAQAQTFTLVDLTPAPGWDNRTPTYGWGLNGRGDVVGQLGTSASTQTGTWFAPLQESGVRIGSYVAPPAGYTAALAYDINSTGTYVGTLAAGGNIAGVNHGSGWQPLPGLAGGNSSGRAYGINDAGTIVGQDTPGNYGFPLRWLPDGQGGYVPQRLAGLGGGGIAHDVNASGQMAGASNVGTLLGATHAVRWQADNTVTDLGVLNTTWNYSVAHALNDHGVVVGESRNAQNKLEAFRWVDGVMTGLGAIPGWEGYPYPYGNLSSAQDVNNAGWIVGSALRGDGQTVGFLWREGVGMVDLNTLVSPSDPFFASASVYTPNPGFLIIGAQAVNDSGQILALARYNLRTGPTSAWQVTHAFLLTPDVAPIPEPATWALWLVGLVGLTAVSRRLAARRGAAAAG